MRKVRSESSRLVIYRNLNTNFECIHLRTFNRFQISSKSRERTGVRCVTTAKLCAPLCSSGPPLNRASMPYANETLHPPTFTWWRSVPVSSLRHIFSKNDTQEEGVAKVFHSSTSFVSFITSW